MNIEIIVRSTKDGRYIIICPEIPGCTGEGNSIEEAIESIIDKIANVITEGIKDSLKATLREIPKKIGLKGPVEFSGMLTSFPISLN